MKGRKWTYLLAFLFVRFFLFRFLVVFLLFVLFFTFLLHGLVLFLLLFAVRIRAIRIVVAVTVTVLEGSVQRKLKNGKMVTISKNE